MNKKLRWIALPVGAAAILGTSGFAFMASNSVPGSSAGSGTGTISGYQVSNIDYDVGGAGIYAIHFRLNHASNEANTHAFIVKGDGTKVSYGHCTTPSGPDFGYAFRCDTDGGPEVTPGQAYRLGVTGAQ